jgi:hypothetical protein
MTQKGLPSKVAKRRNEKGIKENKKIQVLNERVWLES